MLFLNMWLLLGVLGVSIPVIIHLLNRRHAKEVKWGAMQFLRDSIISRRRRVLLEEILLLAARCLIVALAAFALARPFISANSNVPWIVVLPAALLAVVLFGVSFALWRYPRWRRRAIFAVMVLVALVVGAVLGERHFNLKRFGGSGARDVALVLDGSSSMTMTIDGESNFSRAVKEARTYIESAPRGFSFSLIVGGSVPNVLSISPTPDRKRLLDLLQSATPVQGTMQALDTLAVATTTLARGDNPNKQIVMIGDGQSVGWKTDEANLWAQLQEAFKRLPAPPQVIWRRLPIPQTIRNATVSGVVLSRDVVGTDREVLIDVTVANTGGEAITPQELRLTIGETVLTDRSMGQLPPGASATVGFVHRFEHPGTEVIKAQLKAHDEMPGDDEALKVVHIMDRLGVLVVDAASTTRFLDRPGAFVTLALMPDLQEIRAAKGDTPRRDFLVRPELLSLSEFIGRGGAGDARVVVLVDLPQLPDSLAENLAKFVEQGGGLFVIAGRRANPLFYNAWRGRSDPLMPLSLERLEVPEAAHRPALDVQAFSHPALQSMGSTDLDMAQFHRYWLSGKDRSPNALVGASFTNGVPFLAEHPLGRGLVVQVNAPLDASVGNLVARDGFVPLVHELVYYLARPLAANLNLPPSRGATIPLSVAKAGTSAGGLRAEYFDHPGKTEGGTVRVDATVSSDLTWPGKRPPTHVGFWILWTGSIAVPESGSYTFERDPETNMRVVVNGQKIITERKKRVDLELQKGRRYNLRIEYHRPPNANPHPIALTFSGPGLAPQPLPSEFLSAERIGAKKSGDTGIATTVKGPGGQSLDGHYLTGVNGTVALRLDGNLVPGLYTAKVPRVLNDAVKPLLNRDGDIPFSVMVDGEESRLAQLSEAETAFIGTYVSFLKAGSAEDVMSALLGKAFGHEVWRGLAMAALALLFLEVLLTRWISIQRRDGVAVKVSFEDANLPSEKFREQLNHLEAAGKS
jgi:hypothetical protein